MVRARLAGFAVAALSIGASALLLDGQASAATRTWSGAGSDANWNTAANWGGTAPVAGDDIVFPASASVRTVNNNITAGTSFNTITVSGSTGSAGTYTINGNAFTLVAGINNTATATGLGLEINAPLTLNGTQTLAGGAQPLYIGGFSAPTTLAIGASAVTVTGSSTLIINDTVTGSGSFTLNGPSNMEVNGTNSAFTGSWTVTAGRLVSNNGSSFGTSAATVTASGAGGVYLYKSTGDVTYPQSFTLSGNGPTNSQTLSVGLSYGMGGASSGATVTTTISGGLTLGSNITFAGEGRNLAVTGTFTANSHTVALAAGTTGTFTTSAGTQTPGVAETTYSGDNAGTSISAPANTVAIVTGTYGDVTITGGTLKGTGTVGTVAMDSGTIAPGMSPGVLNTGALTFTGGTHQVELGGTAAGQYDQLNVTGAVDLGSGTTLSVSAYNSFVPTAGSRYTIINNDGTDAVVGTFVGLAEGGTVTVGGRVLSISYHGGSGNDVVLTAAGTLPATGFLGTKLPITLIVLALLAAIGIEVGRRVRARA